MARRDYIPNDEDNLSGWALTLQNQAPVTVNYTAMGWNSATATSVSAAAEEIVTAIAAKEAARQAWLAANAAQDAIIASSIGLIRPLVAQGKKEPTATEAIQKAMGVWGQEIDFDPQAYVGDLRSAQPEGNGMLRVKFGKAGGQLAAVNLYLRKTGETTWKLAATMLRSPFLHHVTLATPDAPESYEVRVRGVVGNDEIGQPSPAVTVLVN